MICETDGTELGTVEMTERALSAVWEGRATNYGAMLVRDSGDAWKPGVTERE